MALLDDESSIVDTAPRSSQPYSVPANESVTIAPEPFEKPWAGAVISGLLLGGSQNQLAIWLLIGIAQICRQLI
jgi:hypothetical protein